MKIERRDGDYTWIGSLPVSGGQAILVVKNGNITGQIQSRLDQYSVTPLGDGIHALIKIDQTKFPPEHPRRPPQAPPDRSDAGVPNAQLDTAADPVQVDVLIAYTSAARAARPNIADYAQLAVDAANAAYNNSNANVSLRLVGTIEVNYAETTFEQALDDLTNGTGVMAQVHAKRDETGADLVSLFLNSQAYCGLAWVLSSAGYAFSTIGGGTCPVENNSFAHELGHNFGAIHDPYVDPGNWPYAYGHGYVKPTFEWRTIMAYVNQCVDFASYYCPRIPYFSNPSVPYAGSPTGTIATHDVARVHRERVATVAAFRAAIPPPVLCGGLARLRDFNGNGCSDILFRRTNGQILEFLMRSYIIDSAPLVGQLGMEWATAGVGDFSGDRKADILFRRTDGTLLVFFMNGAQILRSDVIGQLGAEWQSAGVGDLNGDGRADIVFRRTNGQLLVLFMNGIQILQATIVGQLGTDWQNAGVGDINGDGRADLVFRRTNGQLLVLFMNGTQILQAPIVGQLGTDWQNAGVGDFNGDGRADLVFRHTNGQVMILFMNGAQVIQAPIVGQLGTDWQNAGVGDFNGDGRADLLFRGISGQILMLLMNGGQIMQAPVIGTIGTDWVIFPG